MDLGGFLLWQTILMMQLSLAQAFRAAGLQKNLTEKGLKTIMLERGKNIEHIKDYAEANKEVMGFSAPWWRTQEMIKDYPVLKRDYPLNERNLRLVGK